MSLPSIQPLAHSVGQSLEAAGAIGARGRAGNWRVTSADGGARAAQVRVRLEDDWLTLQTPLAAPHKRAAVRPEELRRMLRYNGCLPAGMKFVLIGRRQNVIGLRAEILLDDGPNGMQPERLAAVLTDLATAARRWGELLRSGGPDEGQAIAPVSARGDTPGLDLVALCGEAGWPVTQRASGRLAVSLDAGGSHGGAYSAILQSRDAQELAGGEATVELYTLALPVPGSGQSTLAAFLMLLTASGLVRLVRPTIELVQGRDGEGSRMAVKFQAAWPPDSPPTPAWLGHALSALSVACRLCGRELRLLEDDGMAHKYLVMRGWSSAAQVR